MMVPVRLFAAYAEACGAPIIEVAVDEPVTVTSLREALRAQQPALPFHPLVAVNAEYAEDHTIIDAGDEVALIPPVAGG